MNLEHLKALGLSNGQVSIYCAILELGSAPLNKIHEKTKIERRNIYDILSKLVQRGLITYTYRDRKRTFCCTHPSQIREEIIAKKGALEDLERQIPQIISFFETNKIGVDAQIFRGNEAIKALLNEALQDSASYWMGANSGIEQTTLRTWFKQWMQRRVDQGRFFYDLCNHSTHFEDYPPYDVEAHKRQLYKYHTLPLDLRSFMTILIFGNKVAQILWGPPEPYIFTIDSKEIKESYMKYFNHFWEDPW